MRRRQEILQIRSIRHLRGRARSLSPPTHPMERCPERQERRNSYPNLAKSISAAWSNADIHSRTSVDDIYPDNTLCKMCRGVNAEEVMSESGYQHLLFGELKASAMSCILCNILFGWFEEAEWVDSFQRIVLKDQRIGLKDQRIALKDQRVFLVGENIQAVE